MQDKYGREIHYLRLSVTDKCNLRCKYCMPDGVTKCAHEDVLSYEEMIRIINIMAKLGIDAVRVTGGEPLVKKNLERLIEKIKAVEGIQKVTMTTNGVLLADKLPDLLRAGLDSVNISLDTLKRERFQKITGFDKLDCVLEGIREARKAGLTVKINCVPQVAVNDDELTEIAALAQNKEIEVRFIEMMPVGLGKNTEGMNNKVIFQQLEQMYGKLYPVKRRQGLGPSVCYQPKGFVGTIGFISAMHGKFCNSCNRIRITSQGFLKGCLSSNQGLDVRTLLRQGIDDITLQDAIADTIFQKPMEHHFEVPSGVTEKKGMYSIGG